MNRDEARQLVVRAGLELVKSGLIARTWGNVSCRIDNEMFAITPSGRAYESLKPEEIVLCKIKDTSYEGEIKPSSEKGMHAIIYQTFPGVNFVIHTHQPIASAISTLGMKLMPCTGFPLLGEGVPVAAYGLPGTKKLRENVKAEITKTRCNAVILANHGALCFGSNYEETFSTAQQLEDACLAFIKKLYKEKTGNRDYEEDKLYEYYASMCLGKNALYIGEPVQLYNSARVPDGFVLVKDDGKEENREEKSAALIHKVIYKARKDVKYINQDKSKLMLYASLSGVPLRPMLDDFAQIVGYSAEISKSANPDEIEKKLRGRRGVLIPGMGALYCAQTESDLNALQIVMHKNAFAQIISWLYGEGKTLSKFDCYLMHFIYTKSYAKKAKNSFQTI